MIRCTFLIVILISSQWCMAGDVPFNSSSFTKISGKDVCDFEGEFYEQFGLYLNAERNITVRYAERDGVLAIMLFSNSQPSSQCGKISDLLDLTKIIKKGEQITFKCHINKVGRTKWGNVIGLADSKKGKLRFVTPSIAWKVNRETWKFEEIKNEETSCDMTGYIYGNGWY